MLLHTCIAAIPWSAFLMVANTCPHRLKGVAACPGRRIAADAYLSARAERCVDCCSAQARYISLFAAKRYLTRVLDGLEAPGLARECTRSFLRKNVFVM